MLFLFRRERRDIRNGNFVRRPAHCLPVEIFYVLAALDASEQMYARTDIPERGPARGNPCYIIKGDRRFVKEGACRLRGARRKARRRLCPADKKASFYCYLAHFILYLTGIGVQKKQRFSGTRQRCPPRRCPAAG